MIKCTYNNFTYNFQGAIMASQIYMSKIISMTIQL